MPLGGCDVESDSSQCLVNGTVIVNINKDKLMEVCEGQVYWSQRTIRCMERTM